MEKDAEGQAHRHADSGLERQPTSRVYVLGDFTSLAFVLSLFRVHAVF